MTMTSEEAINAMAAEITKLQAQIQALALKPDRAILKPSKPETFSGKRMCLSVHIQHARMIII